MLRPFYIVLTIFVAVFFKLSFFNVALIASSPIIDQVANQPIFKVGKKRRRTIAKFSKHSTALNMESDSSVGEKEEDEETEKIFKKLRFPSLSFLTAFVSSQFGAIFANRSGNPNFHDHPSPINLNTHLSLSILRI